MKTAMALSTTLVLLCASFADAQPSAQNDGTLVEQAACPANMLGTYEQMVARYKQIYADEAEAARKEGFRLEVPDDLASRLPDREEFARRKAYAGFECQRIKYSSDGLKVVGYIWKPKDTAGRKLPVIIYNRGGNRNFGAIAPWYRSGFYYFVSRGFVVMGSQYRGNDGGEGTEQFGGADVRDVLNLIALAKSLGYVDADNMFMLGESRGGMMTYLALKQGAAVNAAAVLSGVADLVAGSKERPELAANVLKELLPDFDKRGDEEMRVRSAVYWPEKINVPLLLLHGTADWRADARTQALALAERLQELRKPYELIIYAGDDHGASLNREDADRRIVEWFKRHMK